MACLIIRRGYESQNHKYCILYFMSMSSWSGLECERSSQDLHGKLGELTPKITAPTAHFTSVVFWNVT